MGPTADDIKLLDFDASQLTRESTSESEATAFNEFENLKSSCASSTATVPLAKDDTVTYTGAQLEHIVQKCVAAAIERQSKATKVFRERGGCSPQRTSKQSFESQRVSHIRDSLEIREVKSEPPPIEYYDSAITDQELLDRDEAWSRKREEWKVVLNSIEDVWEHYFPACCHELGPRGPLEHLKCHPLKDPQLRLKTQKELVLSRLCLEQDAENVKDARRFLPWLSMIGYKIDQIHLLTQSFAETFTRRSTTFSNSQSWECSILVHILRYFGEGPFNYLGRNEDFIVGKMLAYLYQRGALTRPENDLQLENNFRDLILSLWILNAIQTPRYLLTFLYSWNEVEQCLPVVSFYILNMRPLEAMAKSIEEIESSLQQNPPDLPQSTGENVRCTDLHLQALRNIGGLKIVWTACDRDHLFLDQENGVLRLSWFNRVFVPEFQKYMPMLGRNDVVRTWELLLGHRKHQHDFADLEKIPLPPELSAFNRLRPANTLLFRRPSQLRGALAHCPKQVPDIWDKYGPLANLPRSVPCNYFGRFEERVRILRHYMDTRKPTGLRNLWHDKRDSLTYYTFWAVLVFGGVSVLLAALGLLVGVLQTVAAFKQLEN